MFYKIFRKKIPVPGNNSLPSSIKSENQKIERNIKTTKKMKKSVLTLAILATVAVTMASFTKGGGDDNETKVIEITFVDHLTAGFIEPDVFVEKEAGSGQVYRLNPTEKAKYMNAPVYSSKVPHHHDPFDQAKAGPYEKGTELDMTLAEWLKGSGTASYTCEDGWGHFKAEFRNLAPNSVYTMWHFFMSAPPTTPFNGTLDIPLGDRSGEQSVFKTDANGNASLDIRFETCLQLTDDQLMAGVAVALHSDGKTYGGVPGEFGTVTHVQLFAMLPNADDYR